MNHFRIGCVTLRGAIRQSIGLLFLLAVVLICSSAAQGAVREGDRFGLRVGVWPQSAIEGSLGSLDAPFEGEDLSFDARVSEPSTVAPFVELFGNFHLKGIWWLEGSVGWSARWNVQVDGVNDAQNARILLGQGRVVFIPIFFGMRARHAMGPSEKPHNIFLRGGLSLIFANESPSEDPNPATNRLYSPGSEGAPGFLLGAGAEYFFAHRYALTADANYRYSKFSYGRDSDFDLSGFWLSAGILLSTR